MKLAVMYLPSCRCTLRSSWDSIHKEKAVHHSSPSRSTPSAAAAAPHGAVQEAGTSAGSADQGAMHVQAASSDAASQAAVADEQRESSADLQPAAQAAATAMATPSGSATAAGAGEADELTGAQLHSRGLIKGLLLSRAPWPDMDYEQLIMDAGKSRPGLAPV